MGTSVVAFVTSSAGMAWLVSCAGKAALLLAASWGGAALLRRSPAAARHQLWMLGVVGAVLLPVLCWVAPALSPSSEAPALAGVGSIDAVVVTTAGLASRTVPTWPAWLALAWAVGTMVVAIGLVRGHLAARRLVRAAEPSSAETWSAALREAAAVLGLSRHVQLLRSEAIGSPMTIGVLRPRVLLPAAAEAWSRERVRAVLVHELGHVRRHDTAIQLAAKLACALYWWNPLAWLAAARLRSEREHACDDLVLGAGIRASSYAADLLDVARAISKDAHVGGGATCMVDQSWTEARLRRILDTTAPRHPLRARFQVLARALALGGVATLACTSTRPELPPASAELGAPTSRGTLSVGTPSLRGWDMAHPPVRQGEVDLPAISTEVQRRLAGLEGCYERRLAAKPALAGTVEIHWNLAETGEVMEACITRDTVGDQEIVDCVNKLVLDGGRFPAPRGGAVDVSVPFVFTTRAAVAGR